MSGLQLGFERAIPAAPAVPGAGTINSLKPRRIHSNGPRLRTTCVGSTVHSTDRYRGRVPSNRDVRMIPLYRKFELRFCVAAARTSC
eukprot:8479380-Pyramimonas_sp.AAC.2